MNNYYIVIRYKCIVSLSLLYDCIVIKLKIILLLTGNGVKLNLFEPE